MRAAVRNWNKILKTFFFIGGFNADRQSAFSESGIF